jgi:ketosteroid isomerase-like protein
MSGDPRVVRLQRFFVTLTRESVREVRTLYAADAAFKDPFNDVRGVDRIEHLFAHMFDQVDDPRFTMDDVLVDGDQAFLTWVFHFRRKGSPSALTIRGGSHVRFDAAGRVVLHRDYWDAAEELYEKIPLLGTLMRWLKRQAAA